MPLLEDAEIEAGLDAALAALPFGVDAEVGPWVFGYGSLIWQPEFSVVEQRAHRPRPRMASVVLPTPAALPRLGGPSWPRSGGWSLAGFARAWSSGCRRARLRDVLMPVWRREMRGNGYRALAAGGEEGGSANQRPLCLAKTLR